MGTSTVKTIINHNSRIQYLNYHIDRNEVDKIQQLLASHPDLLNSIPDKSSITTPLMKACENGTLQLVKLLVEKYQADVNLSAGNTNTPLIAAVKRNQIQIVSYLLANKANPQHLTKYHLKVVQFAILQGDYPLALIVYENLKDKSLRHHTQYKQLAIKYKYRYVNYKIFIQNLIDMVDPDNTNDFLTKQKTIYIDPVIDPRETWKKWVVRNIQFKDPPIVQRSQLPQQLQPQNQNFSRGRHFLTRLTTSILIPKISLKPTNHSQINPTDQALKDIKLDNLQIQTIS